jgi:60 kDa SS-A/Ro ribonucleoprotein
MANKSLFQSKSTKLPVADTRNEAGGVAYKLDDWVALAQMACTSFLAGQYYDGDKDQLDKILVLCDRVPAEWVAKVAVYARRFGFMKDTPSLLLAWLARNAPDLFAKVFPIVANNGRMVRNVVQILRSGQISEQTTLPHCVRKAIADWLNNAKTKTIFEASVGNSPSLADVIKMVHPKPKDYERNALFRYIIGKEPVDIVEMGDGLVKAPYTLPKEVQEYDNWKQYMHAMKTNASMPADYIPLAVPDLPFQMLDSLGLGTNEWRQIAMTRDRFLFTLKNLNTFERHGVLKDEAAVQAIANRLMSKDQIEKSMVFPYQILAAYRAIKPPLQDSHGRMRNVGVQSTKPPMITNALYDALEYSLRNVPEFPGKVAVCVDVSSSMHSPVSGNRKGATSVVRCLDVAALFGAAMFRKNPLARIYPFSNGVINMRLDSRDSVTTLADKLCDYRGGCTDWDAPLRMMITQKWAPDLCVYFSDMQGWVSAPVPFGYYSSCGLASSAQQCWAQIRKLNPKARLVMVNLAAYTSVQVKEDEKAMLVGGFTDEVFKVMNQFHLGELDSERWVGRIDSAVQLENLQ